jgi:hypothetical protein
MDPQGRFGTIDQALRYADEYTAELAEAYGRSETDSNPLSGWATTPIVQVINSLRNRLMARISALGEHITAGLREAILRLIVSLFPDPEEATSDDLL